MPEASDCLRSADAILLDGANGVCADARSEAGSLPLAPVTAFAAIAIATMAVGLRWPRVLLAIAALAAVPGAYAMLVDRGDRPQARSETARANLALHDALRSFALAAGCAEVRIDRCEACLPSVELALTDLACDRPAPIDLYPNALRSGCRPVDDALVCGTP